MTAEQLEYYRKYRAEHPELKEYQRKYWKEFYSKVRKKRYKTDPEYRAKELERKRIERERKATI